MSEKREVGKQRRYNCDIRKGEEWREIWEKREKRKERRERREREEWKECGEKEQIEYRLERR